MVKNWSTDETMRQLWFHLVKDFRTSHGLEYATNASTAFQNGGIKGFRAYKWPARCQAPPYLFKTEAQLENLFKRYRFEEDVFSDDELLIMAKEKFIATQERIARPLQITPIVFKVLQKARHIIRVILGEYDAEEHMASCRFGKRACAKVPYSRSYLDLKFGAPLTGSQEHIAWFKNYLHSDQLLSEVIAQCQGLPEPRYEMCETLTLSFVPKSYKSLRSIKPPTLIGSFYTYGLGRVLQDRLLKVGLDIRRLQRRHGRLVKSNSLTRQLVTADLSAASDSLTRELLRRLLPSAWYRACMLGVVPNVKLGISSVRLQSVATMGDGHTFPLQTLIFYSILCAIGELVGVGGTHVSVYGDDLIYPRSFHKYVAGIFPKLHLVLNNDKTFVHDFFRESCGSDCYHGIDVRPFQYEGRSQHLSRQPYAVFLYKLYNGLTLRWCEEEIPQTLAYLRSEICSSQDCILQVPPSFPDGAGLKTTQIIKGGFYSPIVYAKSTHTWVFNYLHVCADFRVVESQYPYYWERLRASVKDCEVELDPWDQGDEPVLRWRKANTPPIAVRSRITGKRLRRLVAGVSSKTRSAVTRQVGSISDWI